LPFSSSLQQQSKFRDKTVCFCTGTLTRSLVVALLNKSPTAYARLEQTRASFETAQQTALIRILCFLCLKRFVTIGVASVLSGYHEHP